MKNWKKTLISPSTSIREAIRVIDSGALKIALVVNEQQQLLGTVTDGDIRRGILRGVSLEGQIRNIMNAKPVFAGADERKEEILSKMKLKQISHIPVLDNDGSIIRLDVLEEMIRPHRYDNWVVLMAGGLGTRLQPLTNDLPKPLLPIGGKPILETILYNFIEYGFVNFYISVNYKAEMIQKYFGDGSEWGIQIRYIHENKKLGTAGALGLLPEVPRHPFIVMNGDVLTKVNFKQLMEFHQEHNAKATMCVREFDFQVPYGVVKLNSHKMISIEEKPVQRFFVNAGIYMMEPAVMSFIPRNEYLDMPSLFETLMEKQYEAAVFPIREYWLDIGRMDDFQRAEIEFAKVFE